jgi:hypothetical protein
VVEEAAAAAAAAAIWCKIVFLEFREFLEKFCGIFIVSEAMPTVFIGRRTYESKTAAGCCHDHSPGKYFVAIKLERKIKYECFKFSIRLGSLLVHSKVTP